MKMNTHSASPSSSILLATALALSLASCSSGSSNPLAAIQTAQAKNVGNFSNTVFLGDSLTTGYQSNSLLNTQQVNGVAPLASSPANCTILHPLLAYPGPPTVPNPA